MQLTSLLNGIITDNNPFSDNYKLKICGISLNSNNIKKDYAFVAIAGSTTHGENFINKAIILGANVVLSDKKINANIPVIIIKDLSNKLSILANNFYPQAKNNKIIAVTGTNGKTSVSSFISQILSNFNINNQVIGTLNNELTTPDIFTLYKLLNNDNAKYTILEVSSHALVQKRIAGLVFEIIIWTNISQDHLDYHQTMENYLSAKLLALKPAKFGIFSKDNEFYQHFADKLTHTAYSIMDLSFEFREFGFLVTLDKFVFEINLLGEFNLSNVMAGYKTLLRLGFPSDEVIKKLALLQTPTGRMQKISNYKIWIDFAHTPDALQNVILALKKHYPQHKISLLFGCGGQRDKSKRYLMGKIASKLADRIILTNDNPRDENPQTIINDIIYDISNKNIQIIYDRELAIKAIISNIDANECILIAGKGHENYQTIGNKKIVFSDTNIVKKLLGLNN